MGHLTSHSILPTYTEPRLGATLISTDPPHGVKEEKTSISQQFLLRTVHSQLLSSQVKADVRCSRQRSCRSDSDGVFSKILTPFLLQQPKLPFPKATAGQTHLEWPCEQGAPYLLYGHRGAYRQGAARQASACTPCGSFPSPPPSASLFPEAQ